MSKREVSRARHLAGTRCLYGAGPDLVAAINELSAEERQEHETEYRSLMALAKAREQLNDAKEMNTAAWQRFKDAEGEMWAADHNYRESRKRVSETRARLTDLEQKRARLF